MKRLALAAAILEAVDDVNGGDIPDHWGVAAQDTMSTPTRLGVAPGVNLEAAMELTACTATTILAGRQLLLPFSMGDYLPDVLTFDHTSGFVMSISHDLAPIHRRRGYRRSAEGLKRCSRESGIMVFQT